MLYKTSGENMPSVHLHSCVNRKSRKQLPVSALFLLGYPILFAIVFRQRGHVDYTVVDFSAKIQIIFLSVAALWALNRMVQLKRAFLNLLLRAPLSYLFAYMLLGLTSVLWSSHPVMTLYRSIEGLVFLVLIIDCVHSSRNNVESLQVLIMFCLIACLYDISMAVRTSAMFEESGLLEFLHLNVGSVLAAAGAFLSIGYPNRTIRLWMIAIFLLVVALSTSTGTYIAFLIGVGALFLLRRSFLYSCVFIFLSLAILLLCLHSGTQPFTRMLFAGKPPEQVATASGRIGLWRWSWEERIVERLVLGYGYDVGEHQLDDPTRRFPMAHNVMVSAAISLGIPGLLLLCLLCASMLRNALSRSSFLYPHLFAACLVVWINSLSSLSIASRVNVIWLLTAWLCVIVTNSRNVIGCSIRPYERNVISQNIRN
jgi:hypothetical protein